MTTVDRDAVVQQGLTDDMLQELANVAPVTIAVVNATDERPRYAVTSRHLIYEIQRLREAVADRARSIDESFTRVAALSATLRGNLNEEIGLDGGDPKWNRVQDRIDAFGDARFQEGLQAVTSIRCTKHYRVPHYNRNESGGAECAACAVEEARPLPPWTDKQVEAATKYAQHDYLMRPFDKSMVSIRSILDAARLA